MPDDLIWQAGIEYGLQALAQAKKKRSDFICYISNKGSLLEAVAFAVYQLDLKSKIRYKKNIKGHLKKADIAILPRVYPLEQQTMHQVLEQGVAVLTTDNNAQFEHPGFFTCPSRDWQALAENLLQMF